MFFHFHVGNVRECYGTIVDFPLCAYLKCSYDHEGEKNYLNKHSTKAFYKHQCGCLTCATEKRLICTGVCV